MRCAKVDFSQGRLLDEVNCDQIDQKWWRA